MEKVFQNRKNTSSICKRVGGCQRDKGSGEETGVGDGNAKYRTQKRKSVKFEQNY